MGWSWSVFFAQAVNHHFFDEDDFAKVSMIQQRRPAPRIKDEEVVGFAYIDDSGFLGIRASQLSDLQQKYNEKLREKGLERHEKKSHGPIKEDVKLGLRIEGVPCIVDPKPEKSVWIRRNARALARKRAVRGATLEVFLGHVAPVFILRRLYFSVLQESYRQLEKWRAKGRGSYIILNPQTKQGLRAVAPLMPHL